MLPDIYLNLTTFKFWENTNFNSITTLLYLYWPGRRPEMASNRRPEVEVPSEDSDEGVVILMVDKTRHGVRASEGADDLEGN